MAADSLLYQGINRTITDYSTARACEELINLRPTTEGLVPVKPFTVKKANVDWSRIFVHHSTDGDKYFIVRRNAASVSVHLLDENLDPLTALFSISASGSTAAETAEIQERIVDAVSFAAAGNVVLFSICDPDDSVYENHGFVWKSDGYDTTEANVPSIAFSVDDGSAAVTVSEDIADVPWDAAATDLVASLESGLNAVQEKNPDLCIGPILIAVAYKTTDGNTFWTKSWRIYDPVPKVDTDTAMYVDSSSTWDATQYLTALGFFTKYGHGYAVSGTAADQWNAIKKIYVDGTKVTLTFSQLSSTPGNAAYWNKDTSIIQSLEVYCSKPVPYLDVANAPDGWVPLSYGSGSQQLPNYLCLPQRKYEDMELGGQLLYHQASIPMASLAESPQEVSLTFGGNAQLTEDTLDVDAGQLVRYGKVLSYNARFHFFKSVSMVSLGGVSFSSPSGGTQKSTKVIVRYEDNEKSGLYVTAAQQNLSSNAAYLVVAPNINIKEVVTYTNTGTPHTVRRYRMKQSSAYNYSYCDTGPYDEHDATADEITQYGSLSGSTVENDEKAAINVTEQYNPFVFRVEHSYLAPANVLDVQPQMSASVDNSYGTYPLNVFTTRGLYALIQGSANVLYGAFDPLSNLVAEGGVPTEMGTFFLGGGALWLVTGRRLTLVSDALSRGPHKYIRACTGYKKISGDQDGVITTPVYDMTAHVSAVEFEVFAAGGRLGFNRFREELYVSNPSYDYSYVLSLKYRQWFKVPWYVRQDEPGSTIAMIPSGTTTFNLLDLENELAGHVDFHLQTRPFSYGYSYSHIHRIVALMRAELSATYGDKVVVALYGSDDLIRWNLLAYAGREGTTPAALALSQVRTPTSARSWRYYTVCIGGKTGTDTELGPVIVDYQTVLRRLG